MGAGATAVKNAKQMIAEVSKIGSRLGLKVKHNVKAGRTVWATDRKIKIVLEYMPTCGESNRPRVGVECICQDGPGSANQKFFAKAEDVKNYPMRGIVVYDGPGFKREFQGVMDNYGAIPLGKFKQWLMTFFDL